MFAKEFDKSSDILESFGIELCKVKTILRFLNRTAARLNQYFTKLSLLPITSL